MFLFAVGVNLVAGIAIGVLVVLVLSLLAIMAGRSLFAKDTQWEKTQDKLAKSSRRLEANGFPDSAEVASKLSQKDISGAIEGLIQIGQKLSDPVGSVAYLEDRFYKQMDLRMANDDQRDKMRAKLDTFEAKVRESYEKRLAAAAPAPAEATRKTGAS